MIQPIALFGNPVLRISSSPYHEGTNVTEIIQDLWDTMYNANGAGLAAPQIGLQQRIFVIDLPDQEWKKVFINPVITEYFGDDVLMEEGCLSIPSIQGVVSRKDEIVIEYYDEDWIYNKENYRGIKSRVIQHEHDHLEGQIWIDKTTYQPSLHTITVLQECKSKTIKTDYPTF